MSPAPLPVDAIARALDRLDAAVAARGGPSAFAPHPAGGQGALEGAFEVRSADGRVRRMQQVRLALPGPLGLAFSHRAPKHNLRLDLGTHALTLWAPAELIELQVGHRWHGFSGRKMREWDERYVVFAEDGGDPLALRFDEADGPVWLSRRGEGRHAFFQAAPCLADFYEALALRVANGEAPALAQRLVECFGDRALELWVWKQSVSREEARR